MEKVIVVADKSVRFKTSGAVPLRYKEQFQRDFFTDVAGMTSGKTKNIKLDDVNIEVFYHIAWTLAKTADKTIPPLMDWLDSFETFPIADIMPELQDMLVATLQIKKN